MIRHLLKLVWHRKRANALIIVEVFFSFLVVFGVSTLALFLWTNSRRPLGFEWRPVWLVQVDMQQHGDEGFSDEQRATFVRLLREVGSLPQVESAAAAVTCPYGHSTWTNSRKIRGRDVQSDVNHVSDGFDRLFGVQVVAGRWFQPGDEKLVYRPVVVDRDLARDAFGSADPIGRRLGEPEKGDPEDRVIGVVSDFRKEGELAPAHNSIFYYDPIDSGFKNRPSMLLVRLRPGTTAAFEGELVRRLQAEAPAWSFTPQPLAKLRHDYFRETLAPLVLSGIVAFFLLLMVGLGLIGVLWQSVLRRTRELGLRRATGASRAALLRQIVGEQMLLTTLGVALGIVIAVQLPLFGVTALLGREVLTSGMLVATGVLYLLALLCALYPSTLAGRLAPAEALRYE
jgi:putative ABC transport system permease protein